MCRPWTFPATAASSSPRDNGDGTWQHEYALHNLNSHRSGRAFSVPLGIGSSGARNLPSRCQVSQRRGVHQRRLDAQHRFECGDLERPDLEANHNANAAHQQGTMFNFSVTTDTPPTAGNVTLSLFRPGGSPGADRAQVPSGAARPISPATAWSMPKTCSSSSPNWVRARFKAHVPLTSTMMVASTGECDHRRAIVRPMRVTNTRQTRTIAAPGVTAGGRYILRRPSNGMRWSTSINRMAAPKSRRRRVVPVASRLRRQPRDDSLSPSVVWL